MNTPHGPQPLTVVWEDEAGLAVVKPAGRLSVPGRGALASGSVAGEVQARWPDAKVVHRLDMATSGLLLFARGIAWQREFNRLFMARQVDKHYIAVVHGHLGDAPGSCGLIDLPLIADWPNRPRQKVDLALGKPSQTRWEVLEHDHAGRWTRLRLTPITGRSHQLRVHLLACGHPIVGDALYAADLPSPPPWQVPPLALEGATTPSGPRLLLHAAGLAFAHPRDGRPVALASDCPF